MDRRRVRDMRTLSAGLKALFSNKVLMGALYILLSLCSASLLAYGFLIDYKLVLEILIVALISIVWLGVTIILLFLGFENFIGRADNDKPVALLLGVLGTFSLAAYIAATIHYFA